MTFNHLKVQYVGIIDILLKCSKTKITNENVKKQFGRHVRSL